MVIRKNEDFALFFRSATGNESPVFFVIALRKANSYHLSSVGKRGIPMTWGPSPLSLVDRSSEPTVPTARNFRNTGRRIVVGVQHVYLLPSGIKQATKN